MKKGEESETAVTFKEEGEASKEVSIESITCSVGHLLLPFPFHATEVATAFYPDSDLL